MNKKNSGLHVHIATREDVPILAEYRLQFNLELSGQQTPQAILSLRTELFNYYLANTENGHCISAIARIDDQVVAIGSMYPQHLPASFHNPTGKWGYILNMYTVPAHRNKGIAGHILQTLIHEGKRIGLTAFELHATPAGRRVYENAGFQMFSSPCMRLYTV